jgi:hypothetical protein
MHKNSSRELDLVWKMHKLVWHGLDCRVPPKENTNESDLFIAIWDLCLQIIFVHFPQIVRQQFKHRKQNHLYKKRVVMVDTEKLMFIRETYTGANSLQICDSINMIFQFGAV